MAMNIRGKHFLDLKDFSPEQLSYLLNLSQKLKAKKLAGITGDLLLGKNICLMFEKPSTRTRCAFEVAAREEGAGVSVLDNTHTGVKESLEDTVKVLGRYFDGIAFRGYAQANAQELAASAGIPVWNALTNEAHPTQALADIMTIQEHITKSFYEIKLVYVGDARNNVCQSLAIMAAKMGMQFIGLGPKSLFPDAEFIKQVTEIAKNTGAKIQYTDDKSKALPNADVIYTDVWVSMGEEAQLKQRIDLLKPYQVTQEFLESTGNRDVKFMHCMPACHDLNTEFGRKIQQQFGLNAMEVTDDVFRGPQSIVLDQAENRLHTIKAVMVASIGK
jgi:ornithine carbamoyltransferase